MEWLRSQDPFKWGIGLVAAAVLFLWVGYYMHRTSILNASLEDSNTLAQRLAVELGSTEAAQRLVRSYRIEMDSLASSHRHANVYIGIGMFGVLVGLGLIIFDRTSASDTRQGPRAQPWPTPLGGSPPPGEVSTPPQWPLSRSSTSDARRKAGVVANYLSQREAATFADIVRETELDEPAVRVGLRELRLSGNLREDDGSYGIGKRRAQGSE